MLLTRSSVWEGMGVVQGASWALVSGGWCGVGLLAPPEGRQVVGQLREGRLAWPLSWL